MRRPATVSVTTLKRKLHSEQKAICNERRALDTIIDSATEAHDKCVASCLKLQQALMELDGVR